MTGDRTREVAPIPEVVRNLVAPVLVAGTSALVGDRNLVERVEAIAVQSQDQSLAALGQEADQIADRTVDQIDEVVGQVTDLSVQVVPGSMSMAFAIGMTASAIST